MPNANPALPPFDLFSVEHALTILVIVTAWVAIIFQGRRRGSEAAARGARVLAVVLVAYKLVETWAWYAIIDYPPLGLLPLHVCGILFFVSAWALWTRRQTAYELSYFWTFAGTSHSLVTPDVAVGFPTFPYFAFFTSHGLLLLAALYGTLVLRMRPGRGSVWRAFAAINLFAIFVGLVNLALGTNYMFLMEKPQASTLMDYLGAWPWYLLSLEVLALVSFGLWYLPFWLGDRRLRAADAGRISDREAAPGSPPPGA